MKNYVRLVSLSLSLSFSVRAVLCKWVYRKYFYLFIFCSLDFICVCTWWIQCGVKVERRAEQTRRKRETKLKLVVTWAMSVNRLSAATFFYCVCCYCYYYFFVSFVSFDLNLSFILISIYFQLSLLKWITTYMCSHSTNGSSSSNCYVSFFRSGQSHTIYNAIDVVAVAVAADSAPIPFKPYTRLDSGILNIMLLIYTYLNLFVIHYLITQVVKM